MEINEEVKKYIEDLYKKDNSSLVNPLEISKKLNVNIAEVINVCVFFDKKNILLFQLEFHCKCGFVKLGDIDILDEECDSCHNKINEYNTYVKYKFLKK